MSEARDYPRLKCVEFGRELITTQDLDPVYSALHRAKLASDQQARLLVAYWCLYHLGLAARLSEAREDGFWELLAVAAANKPHRWLPKHAEGRWPRGTERRHWRGAQSVASFKSVLDKARCGRAMKPNAEHLVDHLASGKTFQGVASKVQELRGFGPWIAFKVADMLERVAGYPVDFADCELGFYDEPARGAALFILGETEAKDSVKIVGRAVAKLSQAYRDLKAPPGFNRRINVQECETVLCKWKSHLNGHYAPGKDTREVFHGLHGWGGVADDMRVGMLGMKYCPERVAGGAS